MTDMSHLDEFIGGTSDGFQRKLLERFRVGVRSHAGSEPDLTIELRDMMEERLRELSDASR